MRPNPHIPQITTDQLLAYEHGSGHAGELVVVQEDDSTTAYQAAEVEALSFTRIQAGAATTAVRDSISSHVLFVII
jgi:hypothetical protein